MENETKKCSSNGDKDIDAISYCGECKIYMCNKCENYHSKLFAAHQIYNLDKNITDIFTGFCNQSNHRETLDFYCKNHNILCCAICICKLNKKEKGLHKDCEVCLIEDIIEEKRDKIKSNIKYLEELSNTLQDSIDNLKVIFEKVAKSKEELKLEIQKAFTKIRNELNNREDELLLEIDKQFNDIYLDENVLKKCEKLPNKVKYSLEKGKKIEDEYNEDKLALFVNQCLNIENNIKDIKTLDEKIDKCKKENDLEIIFDYKEQLNLISEIISQFGKISVPDNIIIDSVIIDKNKTKQNAIVNWIKEKINKDIIKFEKIFIMSLNGTSCKDFHNYCDNKGSSLVLIKTTKNRIFGGFTPLNWDCCGESKIDKSEQTFIFSLDLMKKFDIINNKNEAIYCFENNGPIFGDSDFKIEADMKKGITYANKSTNFLSNNNLELTGGKGNNESFEIEEFEVFKVIY